MSILSFKSQFEGLTLGGAIDRAIRIQKLKSWRNRSSVTVHVNNQTARLRLRKQSTDAEAAWQCFVAGQYEIPVVLGGPPIHRKAVPAKYLDIVASSKKLLIADCGANIGASTLWFKMKYPHATIIAIEPAPDNFAALVANCAPYSDIEPIQAGIGPADASAFLLDGGGGAWGYQTSAKPTSVKIDMLSLETICATKPADQYTPFILKIDIEGAEKDLFEPGSYAAFQRFPVLIYESHDFNMPARRTSSPFFRFHADTGRDFLFGYENVFSFDMPTITQRVG
jgi:FkbM family methyltransferase